MQVDKLRKAIEQAQIFINKAKEVPIAVIKSYNGKSSNVTFEQIETGKASAACKRASLDLTRALTEMRKP